MCTNVQNKQLMNQFIVERAGAVLKAVHCVHCRKYSPVVQIELSMLKSVSE